jgi:hypothetical protein
MIEGSLSRHVNAARNSIANTQAGCSGGEENNGTYSDELVNIASIAYLQIDATQRWEFLDFQDFQERFIAHARCTMPDWLVCK